MRDWQKTFLQILAIGLILPTVSAISTDFQSSNQPISDNWTSQQQATTSVGTINITTTENESVSNVELNYDFPFEVTVNQSSEGRDLYVNSLENGTLAGNYTGDYTVNTNTTNSSTGQFNIEIEERIEGDYNFTQVENEVDTATNGEIAELDVENTGNVPFELNLTSNQSSIFASQDNQTIEPQTDEEVSFSYQIPENAEKGNRTASISLDSEPSFADLPTNKSFNYTVFDPIRPELTNLTIGSNQEGNLETTLPLQLDVTAEDNTGLADENAVRGTIFRRETEQVQQGNQTVEQQTWNQVGDRFDFNRLGQNRFRTTFEQTDQAGEYRLRLTLQDEENNTRTIRQRFTIENLDNINADRTYTGTLAQVGRTSSTDIFELERSSPVSIEASDISYQGNTTGNLDVKIIPPNAESGLTIRENRPTEIEQAGQYRIEVTGQQVGSYTVRLQLDPVDSHVPVNDVEITGSYIRTAIPNDFERDWAGADYLKCGTENLDRSNLEEARYTCEIPFKITEIGNFENNVFPMSAQVYDDTIANKDDRIQTLNDNLSSEQTENLILYGVIGFMIVSFLSLVIIYPRLMFMPR